MYTNTHHSIKI